MIPEIWIQKGMMSTRNGNYVGKYKRLFFLVFKSLQKVITMYCGIYNMWK